MVQSTKWLPGTNIPSIPPLGENVIFITSRLEGKDDFAKCVLTISIKLKYKTHIDLNLNEDGFNDKAEDTREGSIMFSGLLGTRHSHQIANLPYHGSRGTLQYTSEPHALEKTPQC